MSKVLHLTLKKQWFDMILSGVKLEEYREIKPYWINRLYQINPTTVYEFENIEELQHEISSGYTPKCPFQNFTHITFRNGYAKEAPQFTIECKGIRIGKGNADWGAPDTDVFILSLGQIVAKSRNCRI